MIIVGIDPGTKLLGYALLDRDRLIDCGTIKKGSNSRMRRLQSIANDLKAVLTPYRGQIAFMAIEKAFFSPTKGKGFTKKKIALNTIAAIGEARGMAITVAGMIDVDVIEIDASKAKKAATGNGNASKQLVRKIVMAQFKTGDIGEDTADAIAIAIAAWNRHKLEVAL